MTTLSQWNNATDWYDKNIGESGDHLNQDIIRPAILALMGDLTGKTILDVGCGSGYFTALLAKHAGRVTGTDFAPGFISLCQSKYKEIPNLSFSVQDISKTSSFRNEEFDLILAKMVLQYVDNIAIFARDVRRTLKSEGRLVIAVNHPFHGQGFYKKSEEDGKKESPDYFSSLPQTKLSLWNKVTLTWYPKTVENYLMPFVSVGLRLTAIKELGVPGPEGIIPRVLAFSFMKD